MCSMSLNEDFCSQVDEGGMGCDGSALESGLCSLRSAEDKKTI